MLGGVLCTKGPAWSGLWWRMVVCVPGALRLLFAQLGVMGSGKGHLSKGT